MSSFLLTALLAFLTVAIGSDWNTFRPSIAVGMTKKAVEDYLDERQAFGFSTGSFEHSGGTVFYSRVTVCYDGKDRVWKWSFKK